MPYEVGMAYYREIARGQIRGDTTGRLKLIFHRETQEILGVHIIGEGAAELLHIGQAVFALKGTVDLFRGHRFQLSDACRVLQSRRVQRLESAGLDAPAGVVGEGAGGFELGVGNEVFAGFVSGV